MKRIVSFLVFFACSAILPGAAIAAVGACGCDTRGQRIEVSIELITPAQLDGPRDTGSSPPSVDPARIGSLFYRGGFLIRPDSRQFSRIVELSPLARARNRHGCWFAWDVVWGANANRVAGISNLRPSSDPRESGVPERFRLSGEPPQVDGFEFIEASETYLGTTRWIGLWRDRPWRRTRIIVFDDGATPSSELLADLPYRLGTLTAVPALHARMFQITVMGATEPLEPIPYLSFDWSY